MLSCKDLLGLSVLSLYEGELLGTVDKPYFNKDLKKLSFLGLVGEDGTRWLLNTKAIYHIGPNAITIKNKQNAILELSNNESLLSPLNSKAYSIEGEYLGLTTDVTFDQKYKTTKVYLDTGRSESIENLTSSGKSTLIFSKNKIRTSSLIPKDHQSANNEILAPTPIKVDTASQKAPNSNVKLEGRRCTKDIFNFNNEILIKQNTIITKRHIAQIKKYGKLKELMLFSN